MNKLFEGIATEVFFDESTNGAGQKMYMFGELKMQKFAESIVRECVGKIETYQIPVGNIAGEWTYDTLQAIRKDINEHFGVKT